MNFKRLALIALGLVTAIATMQANPSIRVAQAQDNALLTVVQDALTKTQASTSLHIEAQTTTEGNTGGPNMGLQTSIFDLARADDSWNAQGKRVMKLTLPTGETSFTLETVVLDGTVYLRFTDMPDFMAQLMGNLPKGWFDAKTLADAGGGAPLPFAGTGQNSQNFADLLLSALIFPVNDKTVTAIKELDASTLDDQAMRVFQITLDPTAMSESELTGIVGGFGGGGAGSPVPNGGQPPQGNGQQVGKPVPIDPKNVQITFAIYVGSQDGLVHRTYSVSVITTDQGAVKTITVTDLSKFGDAVMIAKPVIGH